MSRCPGTEHEGKMSIALLTSYLRMRTTCSLFWLGLHSLWPSAPCGKAVGGPRKLLTSHILNLCSHGFTHHITSCRSRDQREGRNHLCNSRSPVLRPLHSTATVMESLVLLSVPPVEPPALGTPLTSTDIIAISPDLKSVQGGGALGQSTQCPLLSPGIWGVVFQASLYPCA